MKAANMTPVYGALAALSVLLLLVYLLWEKKKEGNFLLLTVCVAAANCGYFLLACAQTRSAALVANGISYFGAAYALLAMLRIIAEVCRQKQHPWERLLLAAISTAAFALAASGDWGGLYYRSVEIVQVNEMTQLEKTYGPLHMVYTLYLAAYVLAMVALILYAWKKQRLTSPKYTLLLMAAVLLNVLVWAVEQAVDTDFEFLSVSYIVTEVILMLLYGILRDYGLIQPGGSLVNVGMLSRINARPAEALPPGMEELLHGFAEKTQTLSAAERRILNYYIQGYETAEVPELAYVSIHTVKKHNRSIYQKLAVASRDELMLYIELFRCCGRLQELTGEAAAQDA